MPLNVINEALRMTKNERKKNGHGHRVGDRERTAKYNTYINTHSIDDTRILFKFICISITLKFITNSYESIHTFSCLVQKTPHLKIEWNRRCWMCLKVYTT